MKKRGKVEERSKGDERRMQCIERGKRGKQRRRRVR